MTRRRGIAIGVLLVAFLMCLFGFILHRQSAVVRGFADDMLSVQRALALCLLICFSTFAFFSFRIIDLPLAIFLLIAVAMYFAAPASLRSSDAIPLFVGATLGRVAMTVLTSKGQKREAEARVFLIAVILLLAFGSWWQVRVPGNFYTGPRWMGLWNNPNDYGMLMGTGLMLSIALLMAARKSAGRGNKWLLIMLSIAAAMMAVGLLSSFSRGAWVGAVFGLFYLVAVYRILNWKYLLPVVFIATIVAWFCWNAADSAPWRVKRLDLSRGSVTHRLSAWRAGFQIMLDHPLGVGWDNAVEIYRKSYSPPSPNAELAITTNDYLMLGTQLGSLALICFAGHVALCFGNNPNRLLTLRFPRGREGEKKSALNCAKVVASSRSTVDATKVACRAGAIVLLVGFWFDGGLFKLATGPIFWILLALGSLDYPSKSTDANDSRT